MTETGAAAAPAVPRHITALEAAAAVSNITAKNLINLLDMTFSPDVKLKVQKLARVCVRRFT
jgi:hypothetical protein